MESFRYTSIEELRTIYQGMKKHLNHTPVFTSRTFDRLTGSSCFFKCENFQRMGAFKMRGALNAILHLRDDEKKKGVATHSSGNFASAMSLAAGILGVKATVIMPETAPAIKKQAVMSYGGTIIECSPTVEARERELEKFITENGAVPLHPSNQKEVIEGNSSAVIEFLEETGELDAVIAPVGGGGLLAGTALAAKQMYPGIKVYAGEPFAVDDAYWSLVKGEIQPPTNGITVADGLKTYLGDRNFPIIKTMVDSIIRVEEEEIIQSMKWIWERMKIIIEPSSAVAVAAVLKEKSLFSGKKVGIILSGGNVELDKLPF